MEILIMLLLSQNKLNGSLPNFWEIDFQNSNHWKKQTLIYLAETFWFFLKIKNASIRVWGLISLIVKFFKMLKFFLPFFAYINIIDIDRYERLI